MKLLVMTSKHHVHILDEKACKAEPRQIEKDLRKTLKYLPYLAVFRHVEWTLEVHIPRKDSYALSKEVTIEKLRNAGYMVV